MSKETQAAKELQVKIQVPNTIIERKETAEKRLKADAEYTPMDWRVWASYGPVKGRDLDGEARHRYLAEGGRLVNLTYYHGLARRAGKMQAQPALIGG